MGDGSAGEVLRARHRRGRGRARRAATRGCRSPSAPSTSPPATTSPCARSPSWRSRWLGLDPASCEVAYGTEPRGWKGDVPVVRLATDADPRARAGRRAAARARRCGARWRRCSPTSRPRSSARERPAACSSTATACSTRRSSSTAFPTRRRGVEELAHPARRRRRRAPQLRAAGFRLICVTNQPDIARGTQDPALVATRSTAGCRRCSASTRSSSAPTTTRTSCDCRKPKPGMILDAARRWDVDLSRSFTVGDRWRDVEAGRSAGTRTVFVDRGYAEPPPDRPGPDRRRARGGVPWIIATAGPPR